jgi:drug/metabolite transporter (DMT)-like permease
VGRREKARLTVETGVRTLRGSLLILVSAVCFGSLALCARLAYADGVDTATLLAVRFVLAALVLGAPLAARRIALPRGRTLYGYLLMGVVYTSMAWTYFTALHFASSSTVALVLYTYPVIVAAASAALRIDRFGLPEWLSVAASTVGLALLVGTALQGSAAGVGLAFASAVLYAGYIVTGSKLGDTGTNPLAGSWVILAAAGALNAALAVGAGPHLPHSAAGWAAVGAMTLIGGVFAIVTFIAGLREVGPTLASVLSTLEPVVTVALGISFLGEALHGSSLAGALLILGAAVGLTLARAQRSRPKRAARRARPA